MDVPNTILLVDDDDTTNLLNKYFAEAIDDSIDVVTAVNGIEALKFLEENDIAAIGPCYVILDVMMPKMSGFEVCKELRKTRSSCSLPILFLTANHIRRELDAGFVVGGNGYLTKPIVQSSLKDSLCLFLSLLDEHRRSEQAVALSPQQSALLDSNEYISFQDAFKHMKALSTKMLENAFELDFWGVQGSSCTQIELGKAYSECESFEASEDMVNLIHQIDSIKEVISKKHFKTLKKLNIHRNDRFVLVPVSKGSQMIGWMRCKALDKNVDFSHDQLLPIQQIANLIVGFINCHKS